MNQNNNFQLPYYEPVPPAKKHKIWPWVIALCLLVDILIVGGAVAYNALVLTQPTVVEEYHPEEEYDGYNSDDSASGVETYTLGEIETLGYGLPQVSSGGKHSPGLYTVGKGQDIEAGLYYLEGSQTTQGSFYHFKASTNDTYELLARVIYFGNYYAELEEGDVIVFFEPVSCTMFLAKSQDITFTEPLQSGLYRIGTDIPAGTYTFYVQKEAAANASQTSGVYLMRDLNWDENSFIDSYLLFSFESYTLTVEDGDILELYAATTFSDDSSSVFI
jgi:hypothetical protein